AGARQGRRRALTAGRSTWHRHLAHLVGPTAVGSPDRKPLRERAETCAALRGSLVDGRLVRCMRRGLELEGAVVEVEVVAEAGAQRVEDAPAVPGLERGVGDDDVRGEDG